MVFNLVSREGAGGRRRGGPRVARVPSSRSGDDRLRLRSAASSFWMPSRESIAPDAARFVDRRGSALGGRCASRCAVRKSGSPWGGRRDVKQGKFDGPAEGRVLSIELLPGELV